LSSREHVIALEPRGKGLLGITLRYPYEVRKEDEYFEDISDEKIPRDMLELASYIVETKSGHFNPEKFEDHYEDALKELLKKKQAGEKIEIPRERAPAKVINLMEALRQSVAEGSVGKASGLQQRIIGRRRKPVDRPDRRRLANRPRRPLSVGTCPMRADIEGEHWNHNPRFWCGTPNPGTKHSVGSIGRDQPLWATIETTGRATGMDQQSPAEHAF
jgi:hypothetical protein